MEFKVGDLVYVDTPAIDYAIQSVIIREINEKEQFIIYCVDPKGERQSWARFNQLELVENQEYLAPEVKEFFNGQLIVKTQTIKV